MEQKKSRKGMRLLAAVLWTATTVIWTVLCVMRFSLISYTGEGLLILTVFAALASLAACITNWYRYTHYKE